MATRTYGSYCGVARALEIVGERWALLIVRDLLVAPRRFTDLQRGLPRIPTNVLSTRLKELEQAEVVRRRLLPRPGGAIVYELTERGRALEPAVLALGRWGAPLLGEPGTGELVTADSLVMAIRTTFHPERARGLHLGYELRVGDIVVHARIDDGALAAAAGPLPDADMVLETGVALRALMAGELAPADALAGGDVRIHGEPALLATFAAVFRIEPTPAGATLEA